MILRSVSIFLSALALSSLVATAQCPGTGSQSPTGVTNAPTAGNTSSSYNVYPGSYSRWYSVAVGPRYTMTSSNSGDYFTVRSGTANGTLVAFGQTPLKWFANTSGIHYITISSNASCSTSGGQRSITLARTGGSGCNSGSQSPFSTFTPSCTGAPQAIATNVGAGYSTVALTNGVPYTFTSSLGNDQLTIASSTGSIQRWGTSPLVFTPASSGNYRFYTHSTATCGTTGTRTRSITCPGSGGGGDCLSGTQYPPSTFSASCTGSNEYITGAANYGEFSMVALTGGTQYTFTCANGGYVTIGNSGGTSALGSGASPFVWTAPSSGNFRYYIHANSSCGSGSSAGIRYISCAAPVPACATGASPAHASSACLENPTTLLSWSAVPQATGYDVYFDAGESATTLVSSNQAGTSYLASTPTATSYSWRVAPRNASGTANGCSGWWFARTEAPIWYQDLDGDGHGDPGSILAACAQPAGFVQNADDDCPTLSGQIGDSCDDGNASTENDVIGSDCVCAGTLPAQDFTVGCFYSSCDYHIFSACEGSQVAVANLGVTAINGFNEPISLSLSGAPTGMTISSSSYSIEPPYPDGFNHIFVDLPAGFQAGTYTYDIVLTSVPSGITHNFTTTTTILQVNPPTYEDADGDGFGDPNSPNPTPDCMPMSGYVVDNTDDCPSLFGRIGDSCDDGDATTENDVIGSDCVCAGTPVGPCTGNALLVLVHSNGDDSQLSWELLDEQQITVATGGASAAPAEVCLSSTVANACYGFRVMDGFGDGLLNGGWELRTTDGGLLLRDDFSSGSQSPSASPANPNYTQHSICLPAGPGNIAPTECGIFNNALDNKVYANKVIGASNYQFEFSDPDAGFIRRIARPYNYVHFWDMVSTPLVPGVKYFARVRTDRDGPMQQAHFGTGCEMGLSLPQVVTCSELIQAPAYGHSCNETRAFNTNNSFIWAKPVVGANQYQFRVFNTEEGYDQTFIRSTYILQLKWNNTVAPPLINGYTYQVEINVRVNGLYSGFCASSCTITIDNSGNLVNNPEASLVQVFGDAQLWPNPVRDGQVNLSIDGLVDTEQTILVDIQDIYGKQVFAKEYGNSGERFNTILNLSSDIASGVYMVGITVNGERTVQRLSIIR